MTTSSVHGIRATYSRGCRCDECRAANSEYCRYRRIIRAELLRAGQVDPPHGTRSTRVNYECECEACLEVSAAYAVVHRSASMKLLRQHPEYFEHGKASTYSYYGCRCDECTAAGMAHWRAYAARRANTAA